MFRKMLAGIALIVVVAIGAAACAPMSSSEESSDSPEPVAAERPLEEVVAEVEEVMEDTFVEPSEDVESSGTVSQENARWSAESYLETMAFSRKGLIHQLKFEGYSQEDATYAVAAVSPDWNEQAARAAESYLETMPFSRSGLIGQLKFEGFTTEQATYGVDSVGL